MNLKYVATAIVSFLSLTSPAIGQTSGQACVFTDKPTETGHLALAQSFIHSWNEGRMQEARRAFSKNATVSTGFHSDEKTSIDDMLLAASKSPQQRGAYTVTGIMTDGSNHVVLNLMPAESNDDVSEIWVFEVGSGCLTNLNVF